MAIILALAAFLRLYGFIHFPIVHDEIIVMARGFSQVVEYPSLLESIFQIPLTNSNGMTPLWWWAQFPTAILFGETSKPALRMIPFLLGLAGVCLAWRAGKKLGGTGVGLLAGLLYATSDIIIISNCKGENAASLTGIFLLIFLIELLNYHPRKKVPYRLALWPALVLLTYFGHGLIFWGGVLLFFPSPIPPRKN